ncbi:MAG TPA: hypothetical protein VJT13_21675 [Xanthobacteraceae bacterium]|nr:hypothetical protein [Xanthobacteraceae bacterium]
MYYAVDRQKAAQVLMDLRNARLEDRTATLATLQRIRNEVACEGRDQARLQAWASIRELYDAVKTGPDGDLKPLWQDAISRTVAWRESLR